VVEWQSGKVARWQSGRGSGKEERIVIIDCGQNV